MHPGIEIAHESARGCGFRKVGGLYLRGSDIGFECGRLPIPLTTCPCCSHGFKPARGWTWVDGDRLLEAAPECLSPKRHCRRCPLQAVIDEGIGRSGLLWIGEQFYPTTKAFNDEAKSMGISRRMLNVPVGFKVNLTMVLLAHRKAIQKEATELGKPPEFIPGIFRMFRPSRVEVVVSGDEPDDVIEGYLKRGLTPVKVIHEGDAKQAPLMGEEDE